MWSIHLSAHTCSTVKTQVTKLRTAGLCITMLWRFNSWFKSYDTSTHSQITSPPPHTHHGNYKNGKYCDKFSATEFMELPAGHTVMPPANGHPPLTQRARFHPKPALVGFMADEVAVRDDFSPGISVFPHKCHSTNDTHTHISQPLYSISN
jgi:hypothetical protein